MRYSQVVTIEFFIYHHLLEDKDVQKIIESWNVERREIEEILVKHYREMGLFQVLPLEHSGLVKSDLLFQLQFNPELLNRRVAIQKEIERLKARQRR